ncbi:MAG: SRPBCC family protein [Bosea sp. (in: a-proteobacteria)]
MMTEVLLVTGLGAAAAVAATFLLPAAVRFERSRTIADTPNSLVAVLDSGAGYQKMNPYKDADPNLNITLQGPERGIGSGFAFKGKDGTGTQTIIAMEEGRSVTMLIDMGAMGKSTHTYLLQPATGGTTVTWRMDAGFGMNPIGRVFGLFLERMLGPTMERGLANLDRVVTNAA